MDNKNIYELHDWQSLSEQTLRPKIDKILNIIPESVKSIVDIGCGNGIITNQLSKKYHVVGVDRSQVPLNMCNVIIFIVLLIQFLYLTTRLICLFQVNYSNTLINPLTKKQSEKSSGFPRNIF